MSKIERGVKYHKCHAKKFTVIIKVFIFSRSKERNEEKRRKKSFSLSTLHRKKFLKKREEKDDKS